MPGLLVLLLAGLALPTAAEAQLDEALYAELLARHTREVSDTAGTRVDYRALQASPEWRRLVAGLDAVDPGALRTRAERVTFWINTYNVLAIDVVLGGYPVESIKDRGGLFTPVWKIPAGRVAGRSVTLHEIEHEILRPLGDPRIHAAIVCASTSCPSLRREPYSAARLDGQLDDALRRFLADPRKGLSIDRSTGRVRLSRIFDWFAEDFRAGGGVLAYVKRYAPEADREWLAEHAASASLGYFDYDWRLNDTRLR